MGECCRFDSGKIKLKSMLSEEFDNQGECTENELDNIPVASLITGIRQLLWSFKALLVR